MQRVLLPNARRAVWFRAEVMQSCAGQPGTTGQPAEQCVPADRCARAIVRFLTVILVRLRPAERNRWTAAINLAFDFLLQLRSFRQSLSWGV